MASSLLKQNPGIGGLDELTDAEEDVINDLTAITHATGKIIKSDGTDWVGVARGSANQVLSVNAGGTDIEWTAAGTGDVAGPSAASANAIAIFSGTGGKTLLNSSAIVDQRGNIYPVVDDAQSLGFTSAQWSNLFLGTGAVINFNAGDVTVTHSSNKLDIDGGVVDFGSAPTVTDAAIYYVGGTDVAVTDGGTGASTAANARINLGLVIGTDVEAFDQGLLDIAALSTADSTFIVGSGLTWVAESGATARTSLGLTIGTNVQAFDAQLSDIAALAPASSAFVGSDASNLILRSASATRGDLGLIIGTNVQAWDATLDSLAANDSATAAQVTIGTNSTAYVVTRSLSQSDYGKRVIEIQLFSSASAITASSASGFFRIPSVMNGWNLTSLAGQVYTTASATAIGTQIGIRNKTDNTNMLSTNLYIDGNEFDSSTSQTAVAINASFDDVATGDLISVDIVRAGISTNVPSGLVIELQFILP